MARFLRRGADFVAFAEIDWLTVRMTAEQHRTSRPNVNWLISQNAQLLLHLKFPAIREFFDIFPAVCGRS